MSSSLVLYPRKLSFDIPPQFWVSLFLGEKLANEWGWNHLIKTCTSGNRNTALLQSTLRPKVESCDKISSSSCNLGEIIPIIQPQMLLFRFSTTPENVKISHCYLFRKNPVLKKTSKSSEGHLNSTWWSMFLDAQPEIERSSREALQKIYIIVVSSAHINHDQQRTDSTFCKQILLYPAQLNKLEDQ